MSHTNHAMRTPHEYAVSLSGIQKSFGCTRVLDDVHFKLKRGTIHALMGQNGAGKSTLMKILTGVYTCDAGLIEVDGRPVTMNSYRDAIHNGISLIFQELSLVPTMTVTENIFLNRELRKKGMLDHRGMELEAKRHLQSLNIDIDVNQKVENIDRGTCQMIEIAKALSVDSSVLVMDEPTASLSDRETAELFKVMKGLRSRGVSIVYISHRMEEIFKICDTITVMRDGCHIITAPISDYTMESLIEYMIGEKKNNAANVRVLDRTDRKPIMTVRNMHCGNIVKDVSFDLYKGEILGIAGLMGSGRTEIVESLFGLKGKIHGEVTVNGRPYHPKSCQDAIKNGIALVPEDRRRMGIVGGHSVKDNIVLPNLASVKKGVLLDENMISDMVDKSIKALNIKTASPDLPIVNLSGGNQQKVVISKWLNCDPEIMLMDEPTAGVDIGAKGEIIDILRKYVDKGNAAILVSSDIAELMSTCDRFIVLKDGRLTNEYLREDLETEEVLQYAIQSEQ